MKKLSSPTRIILFALIGISLAFMSVAFGSGTPTTQTATPTATLTKAELASEVGSTDAIMAWAIIITLIIIIPIIWHWILWNRKEKQQNK